MRNVTGRRKFGQFSGYSKPPRGSKGKEKGQKDCLLEKNKTNINTNSNDHPEESGGDKVGLSGQLSPLRDLLVAWLLQNHSPGGAWGVFSQLSVRLWLRS